MKKLPSFDEIHTPFGLLQQQHLSAITPFVGNQFLQNYYMNLASKGENGFNLPLMNPNQMQQMKYMNSGIKSMLSKGLYEQNSLDMKSKSGGMDSESEQDSSKISPPVRN